MKKPITIISSICTLLFIIAIIWLGAGVYIDKKNGTQKADSRYEKFISANKENFTINSYGSNEFSNEFIRSIGNIDDFSVLRLEVNGELVYSYPPTSFTLPSPELVKSYSDSFTVNGNNYTIKASIYLMSPNSVYNHSRLAFLIILIGTITVGIFIVLTGGPDSEPYFTKAKKSSRFSSVKSSNTIKEGKKSELKEEIEEAGEEKSITFDDYATERTKHSTGPVFNPEDVEIEEVEDIKSNDAPKEPQINSEEEIFNEEELFSDNEAVRDDDDIDIIDQMEQENLNSSEEDEAEAPAREESSELFAEEFEGDAEDSEVLSPITNLGLQSSLEQKLDEAIVSELHATLAITRINGLDRGNTISQKIISILRDSLAGDEIFEYKSDAYAVIMKGKNLQTAVEKFEKIYNKIADFLKDNNSVNEVSVGISSSSERNVKAERVILEADQALDYASQDPDSPIVAFRANPQKYREFQEAGL